jgi:hypothetical protein
MGTDNATGTGDNLHMFAATQLQDSSSLDRFTINIPVGYLSLDDEVAMMTRRYPSVSTSQLNKVVAFAGLIRESYRVSDLPVTLSPRGICAICEILQEDLSLETAVKLAFYNKLAEDSHKELVKEQMTTCF